MRNRDKASATGRNTITQAHLDRLSQLENRADDLAVQFDQLDRDLHALRLEIDGGDGNGVTLQ